MSDDVRTIAGAEELKSLVSQEVGVSEYFTVTQDRIDRFAEATEDRQWIHTDKERAIKSPFGTTIAHGFLTLSLFPYLLSKTVRVGGTRLAVNCGLAHVRFPAVVPSESSIRARAKLLRCEEKAAALDATWEITVECRGQRLPSCVAQWTVRYVW
jgi:acyl dehydratase